MLRMTKEGFLKGKYGHWHAFRVSNIVMGKRSSGGVFD